MKMEIWKIWLSEGLMAANHNQYFSVYEGYIPELKLTVNFQTSFVNEDDSRYHRASDEKDIFVPPNKPEHCFDIKLTQDQILDARMLSDEDAPEDRLAKMIGTALKEHNLDASDYEEESDADIE